MKAVVLTRYGSPDVMEVREVETPVPEADQVLIRVHAATVHTGDCEIRRFKIMPLFWIPLRLLIGVIKPRGTRILGQEVAGVVDAVGADVTRFKVGDEVIATTGMKMGGYAEYVCLSEKRTMAHKPANISFAEATAIPVAGQNALHFLRKADIQLGQDVLIYGSSGSIGTLAVQLAKHFGAEVTAVCSTGKIELVKSLGADHIIDYTQQDFSKNGKTYDVIFDTIGKSSFPRALSSVKDGGAYIQANPSISDMVRGPIASRRQNKRVILQFAGDNSEDLVYLTELVETGKLSTVIDRAYPLDQAVEAHRYAEEGHKAGNIVLTMAPAS
jgi:NADPH:quinone reductase-like Zn-dependent oxidoreductase